MYGSNGISYKMLVMFFHLFFRHAFSEVPRPIALKLGHMIGNSEFYNPSPKLRGALPPKNVGAKNMQNLGRFYTTSDFDREYLRNSSRYLKSETNSSTVIPPALHEKGPVNFGPLITETKM